MSNDFLDDQPDHQDEHEQSEHSSDHDQDDLPVLKHRGGGGLRWVVMRCCGHRG